MPIEALEGMTDEDLFKDANSDEMTEIEPVAEAPEPVAEQTEPTEQTQARDEQGRFAAEPPAVASPALQEEQRERIPLAEYLSEREKRQTFENELKAERERIAQERQEFQRRLQTLEKPVVQEQAAKPDPLLDPEGYEKYLENKFEEKLLTNHRESSLSQAHRTYKTEFEEAYAAAQQQIDPALRARMQQSRDPGETLIAWHRENKTRAEVGNDPNAYFDKRFEAYLSDPANQAKVLERIRGGAQPQPGAPRQASAVNLPPSLTRATNASADVSADDNDISNDALWRHANA